MQASFKRLPALCRQLVWLCAGFGFIFSESSLGDEIRSLAIIVSNQPEYAVINQLTPHELTLIYWRKQQYWKGGIRIHPVNLHAEHPLRLYFSKVVLNSLPMEQHDYWNGLYFHGTAPPYSVQSEEAALRYVSSTKGAIGYVDACKVDERVKALLWITKGLISNNPPEKLICTTSAE